VRRNRVYNHALNGIKLWNGGEASNNVVWNSGDTMLVLEPGDYTIVNNTFASVNGYTYLAVLGGYEMSTIRLYNNIFYNDNPVMGGTLLYFAAGAQLEADHNLFYNPYREEDVLVFEGDGEFNRDQINDGTLFAQTGHNEHSRYVDPLFVDAANGDFHLNAGSPAVDVGVTNEWVPDNDLEGNPRPAGNAPDLGAYETQ
jgi:hypothetical protein